MTNYLNLYYTDVLNFKDDDAPYEFIWPFSSRPFSSLLNFFYHHKKATTTMFGVALEILIFLNSKRIIDRFGLFWPLLVAQLAQLLRFISYYYIDYSSSNAFTFCCLTELLKGLNFSLIQCSAAILVSKLAPRELKTTAQVIYTGSFIALGTILSGLISKPLFKTTKESSVEEIHEEFLKLFMVNIVISVVIIVCFFIKYVFIENVLFTRRGYYLEGDDEEEECDEEMEGENCDNGKDEMEGDNGKDEMEGDRNDNNIDNKKINVK